MKLLLCSDFFNIGKLYLDRFFDLKKKHTCLFVGYAHEDDETMFESGTVALLEGMNFEVENLTFGFDKDSHKKFDMVFVRGGNTTKLIHYLKKYDQFEYVKSLAEGGAVYVGNSAGSVLAGSDTEWTLRSEPYDFNMKAEFGKDALKGFGFVKKLVFVHCSKYRLPFDDESVCGSRNFRVFNGEFYADYLRDRKLYKKEEFLTIGNNQVLFEKGGVQKILTYDWSHIPVLKKK